MDSKVQLCFFNCLKDAVMSEDPRKVKETLKELEQNDIPIAQLLSMQNGDSDMLLHNAVEVSHPDILRQLLVYADEQSVNQFTARDHLTPISLLFVRKYYLASDEEMLLSLLAAKADPNLLHPSVRGRCWGGCIHSPRLPLFQALQERRWRMAEILLDAGADPHKRDCLTHPIDLCVEKPHLVQRLLDMGCYHHNLLFVALSTYEGRSEESTLHLCKMILPYHSGPELCSTVLRRPALSGFLEVLLYLLWKLKPGLRLTDSQALSDILLAVAQIITPQCYRRFLSAYSRFLHVNQFCESAYLFLLLTARNMDMLKVLFQEAKQRKLEITQWRERGMYFLSTSFGYCEELENGSEPCLWRNYEYSDDDFMGSLSINSMESFDVLSAAAHYISSLRAFTSVLPTLLELGLKSSPLALASFATRSTDDEYEFHLINPEFRDVLTRLSSNCCEKNGSCWFRKTYFLELCVHALVRDYKSESRRALLTALHLGVNIGDVARVEPRFDFLELNENTVEIIKHFEPRPVTSWLPESPTTSAAIAKFDEREPASLMQLSRQAFRSGLGFCRIEEKIKSFKYEIPRAIHDYLCFRDDLTLAYFEKNKFDLETDVSDYF